MYILLDALAWADMEGSFTCHSESCVSLVSLIMMFPLCLITISSALNVAVQPALHKSEIDKSESDNSLSSNMCATSALSRFGRYSKPTLCEWMRAPLGSSTLRVLVCMSVSMELSERRRRVCVDPVSAQTFECAVKEASSWFAIFLITLPEPMTLYANFTATSYTRVRLFRRCSPGIAVDPFATMVGVLAVKCASVYIMLSASILKQLLPLCVLLCPCR